MSKTRRRPRSPSAGACASAPRALAFLALDDRLPPLSLTPPPSLCARTRQHTDKIALRIAGKLQLRSTVPKTTSTANANESHQGRVSASPRTHGLSPASGRP